ncbi:hypothetical protein ACWD04_27485 [Streptomyces sp. NPDC002911]
MTTSTTTEKQPPRSALSGEPAPSAPSPRRRSPQRTWGCGCSRWSCCSPVAARHRPAAVAAAAGVPPPSAVWQALVETSGTHDGVRGYQGHTLIGRRTGRPDSPPPYRD